METLIYEFIGEHMIAKLLCLPSIIGVIFIMQFGLQRRFMNNQTMYLVTYTLNFVAWLVIAKIVFNDFFQDVVVINPYVNDVSLILIIIFYFVMIDTQRYTIIPITISTLLFDAVLLVSSHFNVRIGLLIIGTIIFLGVSYYLSKNRHRIIDTFVEYEVATFVFSAAAWLIVLAVRRDMPHGFALAFVLKFMILMTIVHYGNVFVRELVTRFNNYEIEVNTDPLTNMKNRRLLDKVLNEVVPYFRVKQLPLTLGMFDIDSFKQFNDTYGHDMGDYVLTRVANLVNDTLQQRNADGQVFRYGGEEFVIVFRGVTADVAAEHLATVMEVIRDNSFEFGNHYLTVTISVGVASMCPTDANIDDVLKRADQSLYESKRQGKDRLTVNQPKKGRRD